MKEHILLCLLVTVTVVGATSEVDTRPHFEVQPPSRVLWPTTRGAHAECRASGHPPPEVHWVDDEGQVLTTIPGLRHVFPDGRLILGTRKSVAGETEWRSGKGMAVIRCKAINRAGNVLSRPVLLQPVEDSILDHNVRQLTPAKVGGSVVLRCEMSPKLGIVEVIWLQNDLPLLSGYIGPESRWVYGAGGLLFGTDLTQADIKAEYACVVLDTVSPTLKLTTDDSSWLENIELSTIEARVGDTVILPCLLRHITGHSVIWERQQPDGTWVTTNAAMVRGGTLLFIDARVQNSTRYACSFGTEVLPRVVTKLMVYEPLTVNIAPNPLIRWTGGAGYFNCSVKGGQGEEITTSWQHEGRPLHAHQSRLAVGPVRNHHAGLYQCTAYDHTESAVAGAELVVADRPPRFVSTFSEAVTRLGQSIVFRCAVNGHPSPQIHWTLDDRPLPSALEKYTVNTKAETTPGAEEETIVSTLSITVDTADVGGRYGCNATNSRGSVAHYARLNVFGPPNIRYLPSLHVTTGTDVKLSCPYSGYPIKKVLWRREDGSIIEPSLEPGDDRGIIKIHSIKRLAAGSYVCEVISESGELARRTVKIEVHKPPKLMPFHFPEELEIGGSTQATCSLVAGDKPIQFTWQKDNFTIPSLLRVEQKNMDFFSLLIIQDLNAAHNGEYTCRASNDYGVASQSSKILVKEPPSWVWRAQNTTASTGTSLLLPCLARGHPTPNISWEYSSDGETWQDIIWDQPESSHAGGRSFLSDGTIWLKTATREHEGWYRCSAVMPHVFRRHTFYVDVQEPPKLTRGDRGGEARWVVRGAAAKLTCIAKGEHEIQIHWTHDSRPLTYDKGGPIETKLKRLGSVITSEVTIKRSGPEYAGEYKCHAKNLYGRDELIFRLFVKERPNVPEEVRISEVWSRRARVTWRTARGAMVSHYSLQYRALTVDISSAPLDAPLHAPLDSWDTSDIVNITFTYTDLVHVASEGPGRAGAEVTDLAPDTRYALRLAAYNDVGASAFTSPLHFTTREEAPGGAPHDVILRALHGRELHVTWQPPPRETWHGTLLGYTIRWWEVSEDGKSNESAGSESGASGDATSTTIRGLKPATKYGVTMRAYNAAGTGPISTPQYKSTLESPPTGRPEMVTCIASWPTSLRVTWKPLQPESRNGLITYYTLQYTISDSDPLVPSQDAYLRVQGEEATISKLTPYTKYEIRVRAHNAAGVGPLTSPQICKTGEDVPSAPGGMKLIALSERSIRASWIPPSEPNGNVIYYSLYVKDSFGPQEPNITQVDGCPESDGSVECMKTIRGLQSGITYQAWVRAATSAGEGPPTPAVSCTTSGEAPARISSFGRTLVGSVGDTLTLRCVVGGVPPPTKRWMRAGRRLHLKQPFYLDGDALLIRGVGPSLADNYTCVAENPHGLDSVTWKIIVLRPPAPPELVLIESRSRELEFELRTPSRIPGFAIAKNYSVHWRLMTPEGEWRVQMVAPGPVVLTGLRCGSHYVAYASAGGPSSNEKTFKTAGSPPIAPTDSSWIKANTTYAKFDTRAWSDGGCGHVALKLEWAGSGITGVRDIPYGQEVLLSGLMPGTRYRIAARASNEAGWTREIYEFTTLPSEGGLAAEVDAPFPATAGELALLLALCAALSLAALTILAILLRRKRTDGVVGRVSTSAEKPSCGTYRAPPHQPPKLPPDPPDAYEISPYATFAEANAGSSRAYTLQLRALARHDDDAAPPTHPDCYDETCVDACDAQRRRRRRRYYCPDHESGS